MKISRRPTEIRARDDLLESTRGDVINILAQPYTLDGGLDKEEISALRTNAQNLFVPNIREGVVSIPKEYYDTDYMPMVATKPGENVVLGKSMAYMAVKQVANAVPVITSWLDPSHDNAVNPTALIGQVEKKNSEAKELLKPYSTKGTGFHLTRRYGLEITDGRFNRMGHNRERVFIFRPLLGLVLKEGRTQGSYSATMVHELTHVGQSLDHPVRTVKEHDSKRANLVSEKEAYYAGATYKIFRKKITKMHGQPEGPYLDSM